MKILTLVLFLTGCGLKIPARPFLKYKLANGTIVECQTVQRNYCGMSFYSCNGGAEYECQINVEQVK